MSTKPLDVEYREQLSALLQKRAGLRTAEEWGLSRGTLAEAAQGLPKRASTRFVIETMLKEGKKPI